MTLEELIRDRAKKGELVHVSLVRSALDDKWCAVYAPAHTMGIFSAEASDPVEALVAALTATKSSRKKVTAAVTKEETAENPDERAERLAKIDTNRGTKYAEAKPGKLDDWMTKI